MEVSHAPSAAMRQGLSGGLIAGIVFAFAQMIGAWFIGADPFSPFFLIASIPLQTPPENIGFWSAVVVGGIFHLALSALFGVIAAFVLTILGPALHSASSTLFFATLFGFLLWPLNFYFFAPLLNVSWFATETDPFLQFLYHTFFYGTVLGLSFVAGWVHAPEEHMAGKLRA